MSNKLSIILEFARVISEETNLEILLKEVSNFSKELINADRCSIYIYDESSDELWTKIADGLNKELRFDASKGIAGSAVKLKESQIVLDPYNDDRFNKDFDKETGYLTEQVIAIPLLDSNKNCIGVLQVLNKLNGEFVQSDIEHLLIISSYTSMIIKNALLSEVETMLLQQSKMAEMGSMLDNILHQWKQPLSVISMISNYNKLLLDTDQFSIKDFIKSNQQIIDQVNFMNETSDSFRNFFSEKKQNQEFYLYKTVENIIKILSHKIKQSSVNISKDYDENISLFGIENDFSQVILSIINNALDKFENNTYESNMYIDIKNIDGKKVLRIRDNGGLINEELLPTKLFNRHVTTKKTGTGLGLAICKSVIRNHFDGDIFAYNENGLACFEIRI